MSICDWCRKAELIMKVCTDCNQEYNDEMFFCPKCGKKLVDNRNQSCPNCKQILEKKFEFCPYCGYKLLDNNRFHSTLETADQTPIANDSESDFNEGLKYLNGKGVRQDCLEAEKLFRKAAEQGHAKAQMVLGAMFLNGTGIRKNSSEAAKWYGKAAEQGLAEAQHLFGMLYRDGKGVEQSYEEAVKWFRKAAEQGLAEAQNDLGARYVKGQGVEQSCEEAVKWYGKAAEQGHIIAQYNLGKMYQNGQGVKQDYIEAEKWFRKAAEQGDAAAQYELGNCYMVGRGVKENIDEAAKWFRKAAEQGYEDSIYRYNTMLIAKKREEQRKGCFITTAVCGSLGKPDDCDELMTMRRYRDKLKAEDKDMASLIEEYYRIAPLVVQKIDKSNEARIIYKDLWTTSISKIYENIKQGKFKTAKLQYINMLERLCVLYNVPFSPGIKDTIERVRNPH